jgi:hypothetical protein
MSPNDKAALVFWILSVTQIGGAYNNISASNETGVRRALDILPFAFHQAATMSVNGQPRPTDVHSDITPFQMGWNFEGEPDYIFWSHANQRITAVVDAKKPWTVRPRDIAAVLNGHYLPPCR